jgi:SAM-dependent methyltransferase
MTAPPVSEAELSRIRREVDFVWHVVEKVCGPVPAGTRVLDVGCGYGSTVWLLAERGYDAVGFDVLPYWDDPKAFGDGRPAAPPSIARRLSHVPLSAYRLPYPDQSIDIAISSQVFEHVADFVTVFRELGRVLKPGGVSVNIVPARWRPLEGHTYVPLATVLRGRSYLGLWAFLGVRNEFQQGKDWRTVRDLNYRYLNEETFYPTRRMIRRYAGAAGVEVSFRPDLYISDHPGIVGRLARKLPFPLVPYFVEQLTQRVMLVRPGGIRRR